MDFTIKTYCKLLDAIQKQGFAFQTFTGFIDKPAEKVIILRQDVDRLPENSLQFARIQAEQGVKSTYYFRTMPDSWNEKIIREIYELGHEIGYHYEDVTLAAQWLRTQSIGLRAKKSKKFVVCSKEYEEFEKEFVDIAIESFAENLDKLKKIAPVKTICMHGSPMSKWDNRLLWKYYDYHDFGIIGEPYFDIDFDSVLYLTDTGRRWDGGSVSVRDKASGVGRQASGENPYIDWKVKPIKYRQNTKYLSPSTQHPGPNTNPQVPGNQHLSPLTASRTPFPTFHSTPDIIKAAEEKKLQDKVMMTFHPQRWTERPIPWAKELVWQNVKNAGKYFLISLKAQGNSLQVFSLL